MKAKGMVYLVGAGPGDAGLLTLRGAELLGRSDVVVYDALVNPDLLRLAPKSAEIIYGGKRAVSFLREKARRAEAQRAVKEAAEMGQQIAAELG